MIAAHRFFARSPMKQPVKHFLMIVACFLIFSTDSVFADISITNAWIRATHPQAKMSAAYMTIRNAGSANDRLLAASSPICEVAELHHVLKDNGMMKMRPVAFIEIPGGGEIRLKKGGFHIMFIRLKHQLKPGSSYPVKLTFEKKGAVELNLPVKKM